MYGTPTLGQGGSGFMAVNTKQGHLRPSGRTNPCLGKCFREALETSARGQPSVGVGRCIPGTGLGKGACGGARGPPRGQDGTVDCEGSVVGEPG